MTYKKNVSLLSPDEIVLLGAGVAVLGAAIFIGSQVAAGVFTGLVSGAGITYTILKTRTHAPRIFNSIVDKPLLSDIVIDVGVFLIVGGTTVTGIVAGASASLFTSIALNGIRRLGKVELPLSNWSDYFKRKA